mgnify:CR=1 FL=1
MYMKMQQDNKKCPGMKRSFERCERFLADNNKSAAFFVAALAFRDRLEAVYAVYLLQYGHELCRSFGVKAKLNELQRLNLLCSHDLELLSRALSAIEKVENDVLWTVTDVDYSSLDLVLEAAKIADRLRKSNLEG